MKAHHVFRCLLLCATSSCVESAEPADRGEGSGKSDSDDVACASPEIRRIDRPVVPDDAKSPSFSYAYRVSPGTQPDAPAIVFLTGGPGQGAIATDHAEFPAENTLVLLDPRGVGCNAPKPGEQFPEAFYTTENLASDVVAVLADLKPSAYVIYGVSYGTMLATVTAGKIASGYDVPAPKAVVLEGVLTRAFHTDGEVSAEFSRQWLAALDRATPEVQSLFANGQRPLELSAREWGGGIQTALMVGNALQSPGMVDALLALLQPGLPPVNLENLKQTLLALSESAPNSSLEPHGLRMHKIIGCNEIVADYFDVMHLIDGKLVPMDDLCPNTVVPFPYDAADHSIKAPIVYLQGERDPATPYAIAREHLDTQPQTERVFISVPDGGHNVRSNFDECAPMLFASIAAGGADLEQAVAACPVKVERFSPAKGN
jgi:pimeloyl-ACP methyl ester carboxylesterase